MHCAENPVRNYRRSRYRDIMSAKSSRHKMAFPNCMQLATIYRDCQLEHILASGCFAKLIERSLHTILRHSADAVPWMPVRGSGADIQGDGVEPVQGGQPDRLGPTWGPESAPNPSDAVSRGLKPCLRAPRPLPKGIHSPPSATARRSAALKVKMQNEMPAFATVLVKESRMEFDSGLRTERLYSKNLLSPRPRVSCKGKCLHRV